MANVVCIHSCKGLCNALNAAQRHEEQAVKDFQGYIELCDYPDVRQLQEALVARHNESLALVTAARAALDARFAVVDDISASFR